MRIKAFALFAILLLAFAWGNKREETTGENRPQLPEDITGPAGEPLNIAEALPLTTIRDVFGLAEDAKIDPYPNGKNCRFVWAEGGFENFRAYELSVFNTGPVTPGTSYEENAKASDLEAAYVSDLGDAGGIYFYDGRKLLFAAEGWEYTVELRAPTMPRNREQELVVGVGRAIPGGR